MSGYRDCACRDCFEIAIGDPGALCNACEDAGCDPDEECRAPHTYCSGDSHAGDPDVIVAGVACCPVCGQPW